MKVKEANSAYKRMRLLVDEELLQLIDQGNSQALECLIKKYKGVVWGKAQTYFLIGGDREDIIQEGMIGLYKRSEEHTSELQSRGHLVCRLLLEKKNKSPYR